MGEQVNKVKYPFITEINFKNTRILLNSRELTLLHIYACDFHIYVPVVHHLGLSTGTTRPDA